MSADAVRTVGPHLAEMDRLLRDIQTELVPDREPSPAFGTAAIPDPPAPATAAIPDPSAPAPSTAAIPDSPAPVPADPASPLPEPPPPPSLSEQPLDTTTQLQALTELSESLVASMRELLDGYERVLAHARASTREPTGP